MKRNSYYSAEYITPERLSSIGWQYQLALENASQTFLNVGLGTGLLEHLLENSGRIIHSLDIDIHISPTVLGDVKKMPYATDSYDVVMAFQVLEHLPLNVFRACLHEMSRVASNRVIISLPDQSPWHESPRFSLFHPTSWQIRTRMRTLLGRNAKTASQIDRYHLWELGYQGIGPAYILQEAQALNLQVVRFFRNPHYPYHHFFVFSKDCQ